MSHWAEIDGNNTVIRVIVGDNNDPNGDEGYKWITDNLGGRWVQTSYNGLFRKQFASSGSTYNAEADVFISAKPFDDWVLNDNYDWQPPVPKPLDGDYLWNQDTKTWDLLPIRTPQI